ncbi:MAG: CinA family protein [Thermoplasmata archaeon]
MSLPDELGSSLKARNWTVAVAESCTGGKLGDMITSVPGSSDYFLGGVISYSNSAKVGLLSVDPEVIRSEGAVSEKVALQMAEGARIVFGADMGVSTTGVAGPGGGSPEKPVGLAYVAVSTRDGGACRKVMSAGARDEIKRKSSESALALAIEHLADRE